MCKQFREMIPGNRLEFKKKLKFMLALKPRTCACTDPSKIRKVLKDDTLIVAPEDFMVHEGTIIIFRFE